MLVLTRKLGEEIVVGDNIRVKVLAIVGNRVRLGLEAPPEVSILRRELEMALHCPNKAPPPDAGRRTSTAGKPDGRGGSARLLK